MLKAICMDMGETLVNHTPSSHEILGAYLGQRGIPLPPATIQKAYLAATTWYFSQALGHPTWRWSRARLRALGDGYDRQLLANLGLGTRRDIVPDDLRALFKGTPRTDVLFTDVLPALQALRDRGVRLAIVSNWDRGLVDRCLTLGLTEYFETIVGSAAVGYEKPDPAIFDCALARLGIKPSEAWHIGDLYFTDVLGARAAGLTPVLLDRHNIQDDADCRRVSSLAELIGMVDAHRQ